MQAVPITGGTAAAWQRSTGESLSITGLDYADGSTVYVVAYDRQGSLASETMLAATVTGGAIPFELQDIVDNLLSTYKTGDFITPGIYPLRLHASDGEFKDIVPPPGVSVMLRIRGDGAVALTATPIDSIAASPSAQSLSLSSGGQFDVWQTGDGQDIEITGLSGDTGYLALYTRSNEVMTPTALAVPIQTDKIVFKLGHLVNQLHADYTESGHIIHGYFEMRVHQVDGSRRTISPHPSANELRLRVDKDPAITIPGEGVPTVEGDSIPTVEGDPLPTVEG